MVTDINYLTYRFNTRYTRDSKVSRHYHTYNEIFWFIVLSFTNSIGFCQKAQSLVKISLLSRIFTNIESFFIEAVCDGLCRVKTIWYLCAGIAAIKYASTTPVD
ncbi:hypothetical protein VPIG_00153 [Vibrio phage PWH3a-P1]|uniref:hypothetical protein n=1 Tax=Vibrio phage PWH3a-P1 TaxID=754058 RepID=UPI0002C13459|nr:hypothetical protein VPIG_00153 [Vibrio phage PWH3a-P1]AGH32010.1 hypothetical protein VPIG_00153 [Vibrio phage PWH3a-P1]